MGKNDLGKCIILLLRRIFQIIVAVGNKSEHTTKGTPLPPPHPPKVYFVKSVTIGMWDSSYFYPLLAFT